MLRSDILYLCADITSLLNFLNFLLVSYNRNPLTHDYIVHNQILKEKDAVKYFGVTVHHKLSWNKHICSVVKKASSSTGFFRWNLQIHQKHITANACETLVRPQIEYASTKWDPFTQENQNKIEMVQRRAARFACNNYRRAAKSRPKINKNYIVNFTGATFVLATHVEGSFSSTSLSGDMKIFFIANIL